ncbi:MAG: histidine ammonia-lyase [Bacteroidetes bacterium]|nr:histidine ammonia-lyase [Bacteroidota bacterium]
MSNEIKISDNLTFDSVIDFLRNKKKILIDKNAYETIKKCNEYLLEKIKNGNELFYGINTGFGSLCNTKINSKDIEKLQENLLKSHACGVGDIVPDEIVRLMILFKVKSLSLGYSGVKPETVQRLADFNNFNLIPHVFKQGSLGASGDLAPLAHLCLPIIGKGKLNNKNASNVLKSKKIEPLKLGPKEGLALINGTQFMTAYGFYSLIIAKQLSHWADKISVMSLEAFNCSIDPFLKPVNRIRKQDGQQKVADKICKILEKRKIREKNNDYVQDPYSFRCIPQVHGATLDVINQVEKVFTNEINSVTDNPNIFYEEDLILSGGNFHGQTLALHADFLSMAVAELGNISERRIYKLISGERNLPPFLISTPGLNSGFMIPQYTAASIVSLNKQLCTPSSVDSIMSSNGQEDHVSMGANAMLKLAKITQNTAKVLAIELFTSAQALEFRDIKNCTTSTLELHKKVRKNIPFIKNDTEMHDYIRIAEHLILNDL